ncbi:nuclear transport factor 2 family protein [Corynebacterium sp. AOP40-9SA-29]|uniref:nuclear transport factor 2 family protein n=1 Tax=Corynebacterium sp. AOP40-9SA-29 TaxID=3457677 RepID=UPI0040336E62
MKSFETEELLEVEHAGWTSLCESRGGTFYGRLLTDDAVFVLVNGLTMSREQVVDSLDGAPSWDTYKIEDVQLIPVGEDAAALTYRATATRSDLAEPFIALMSSVYRRVDGEPRLVLYQQTAVSGD